MNSAQADSDVVVVGAGIGGAVLSLALAARGWKLKVLEREGAAVPIARPEILWGSTPAALDRFGVGNVIRQQVSVRVSRIEMARGSKRLIAVPGDVLERAGVEAYSTDPSMSRAAIIEAAVATGNVAIVRGAEVLELIKEGDRIVGVRGKHHAVPFEERARLTVGDDGVHSVVRRSLEIPMDPKLFPVEFVSAAIPWPDTLPVDQVRMWMNPPAFQTGMPAILFVPWPGHRGAILIPLGHQRAETLFQAGASHFWSELEKLTPVAVRLSQQLRFPEDFKRVRRPYGHAPRYVADGAAIIGDAAHPMSPVGGQGANASIWDALALADVAHEGLTAGDVSRQRLNRYEALRRPANARSVRLSVRAARIFGVLRYTPGLQWFVPAMLRAIDASPSLKQRLLSAASTTFVSREPNLLGGHRA